jgi:hypothetical protein
MACGAGRHGEGGTTHIGIVAHSLVKQRPRCELKFTTRFIRWGLIIRCGVRLRVQAIT